MKSTALKRCWSLFGGVLILSIALLNAGCCSHRKTVKETRSEATEQLQAGSLTESRSESEHAAILTNRTERQGETVTEIEVYDTNQPTDSTTGLPPVKARIRQRHRENGAEESRASEAGHSSTTTEAESAATYQGITLDEETETTTKSPGERAWAGVIILIIVIIFIIQIKRKKK